MMKKLGVIMMMMCVSVGVMGQNKLAYPFSSLGNGYPTYNPQSNELIPTDTNTFQKVFRNHFSFLTTGQGTTAPAVSVVSIDLLDARFDIKGSIPLTKSDTTSLVFMNIGLSGDRDGNLVSLFNGNKAGGKFNGEVSISFAPQGKFFWDSKAQTKMYEMMGDLDRKLYPKYMKIRNCTKDLPDGLCDTTNNNKEYDLLFKGINSDRLKAFKDTIIMEREKIYMKAPWSSIHMYWLTVKGKIGGNSVYTINQTMNYVTDSVQEKSLITGLAAFEGNYFYENPKRCMLYLNVGLGLEWTDNIKDLRKVAVTESISMKDTSVVDPNGQKRDIADKYDAYNGTITKKLNFLVYSNLYIFPGDQRLFGFKFGAEYRNDLSTLTDEFVKNTSLIGGFIANIPKKGDAKSLIGVEIFLRVNGIDRIDFDNDNNTSIGLAFNVPIPMLPK